MKILIACVNYNTYDKLELYLESLNTSAALQKDSISVDVYISDNSSSLENREWKYENLNVYNFIFGNVGYLGGAFKLLNNITLLHTYDYIIVSNVDLTVNVDFFTELSKLSINQNIGWIAPSIKSLSEHKDRNPKIIKRYSKNKLYQLRTMYKYPILHYLYERTIYPLKKYSSKSERQEQLIYAGHGSFMIFTRYFICTQKRLYYPIFLFGEELFFAELMREQKLQVLYTPQVQIIDFDHASTSKMKSRDYYKYNFSAIHYILERFYK